MCVYISLYTLFNLIWITWKWFGFTEPTPLGLWIFVSILRYNFLSYFNVNVECFLINSGIPLWCNKLIGFRSFCVIANLWRLESMNIFCLNDVMCRALWHHLLSFPCQLSILILKTWGVDSPDWKGLLLNSQIYLNDNLFKWDIQ